MPQCTVRYSLRQLLPLPAATLLLAGLGCGEHQFPAATGTSISDSAGVTVVGNSSAAARAVPEWGVHDPPLLDVGVADGDVPFQLYRVVGAVLQSDGSLVIANGGTSELRYFDGDGRHLRSVGRWGAGPGEFGSMQWIQRRGDSLLVLDSEPLRLSVFSRDGSFVRAVSGQPWIGMFADGTTLSLVFQLPRQAGQRLSRERARLVRHAVGGDALGELADVALWETYRGPSRAGRYAPLFQRNTELLVHRDRVYVADNATYEIRVLTPEGAVSRLIRILRPNRPVTSDDIEELVARRLDAMSDGNRRRQFELVYRDMPVPETMPAYGTAEASSLALPAILLDDELQLWVREYHPDPGSPQEWTVFDARGVVAATVKPPPGVALVDVCSDAVVGRYQDHVGVESVRVYALRK